MIYLASSFFGVLAAIIMHGVMVLITKKAPTQINFVEALGTLITGKENTTMHIGLIVHLISGAIWGVIYYLITDFLEVEGFIPVVGVSLFVGFVHGILTSYALLTFVSDKHPIQKYRNATMLVGAIHWLGHIVFGGFLGAMLALFVV